jgi:hypothetical protein
MGVTRDQFLAAIDMPRESVHIPRLGDVWVRTLTAEEREAWEVGVENGARSRHQIRATLVAMTACDEAGTALFTLADVPALAKKPAAFILPLFDAALRLSRVSATDIDELEKNSEATPADSSPTA